MSRISLNVEALRSEDATPRTLTFGARLIINLDWLRSERLQRNALSIICLLLVIVAFLVSLAAALRLKMHTEPPYWVTGAVPPALSSVAYGHNRPYMSLNFVHDSFYSQVQGNDAGQINRAIANILAA